MILYLDSISFLNLYFIYADKIIKYFHIINNIKYTNRIQGNDIF